MSFDASGERRGQRLGQRWATHLRCSATGHTGALDEPAFLSPAGMPWLVEYELDLDKGQALAAALPGRRWSLWRYRELLPVRGNDFVDLGEGATPLIPLRRCGPDGIELLLKQEAGNPTGSFKDRGLSLAVNRARELGAAGVQLASAGNAGISLSAYAAACGLSARVAMPEDVPETVVRRCRNSGAEVLTVGKNLVESGAHLAGLGGDLWTLSTLKEPYRIEGKKTMGLEIAEQLHFELPDWLVYPTGGGTGIVGMAKAFDELERLGLVGAKRPRFVAVQMEGCAPIVEAFRAGATHAEPWRDPQTRVWGLRVPQAIGDFLILDALRSTGGTAVAVAEHRLEAVTRRYEAGEGVVIGPEGAAVLAAVEDLVSSGEMESGQRVVAFQTGHPANY